MKRYLLVFLVILVAVLISADESSNKMGVLEGIFLPQSLVVIGDRVIVAQKSSFHVFRLPDLQPVKEFCREGEGPGELQSVPMIPNTIELVDGILVAEGVSKILGYSVEDFSMIREQRKGGMVWNFLPAENGYIYTRFVPKGGDKIDIQLVLAGRDLREIKVLHHQSTVDRDQEVIMLRDPIGYGLSNGEIYVEKSNEGFVIDVYDLQGTVLRRIAHSEITTLPVSGEFKKQAMETLRSDPLVAQVITRNGGWENFKKITTFTFPENFPVIRNFKVKSGRIYVLIPNRNPDQAELIVMDRDGRIEKRRTVPFTPSPFFTANALGKNIFLWDVQGNQYYYVAGDDESGGWDLCRIDF